jgi:Tol biopolymer transport system component
VPAAAPMRGSGAWIPWIGAAVACLALIGTGAITVRHLRETAQAADAVRFLIAPPANTPLSLHSPMAISPDGQRVVFGAISNGVPTLWIRPLATLAATPLAGTAGATFAFWSPDSRSIAFFADQKLMKMQLNGGPPIPICPAPQGRGGAWNEDNTIVFAPSATGGLQKVGSGGGTPVPVTTPDKTEVGHRFPWFLPDGRHFLYAGLTTGSSPPTGTLWIGSLDSSERVSIGPADSAAMYSSGHLLFVRGGILLARPFDPDRRTPTGEPFPIADQVLGIRSTMKATFSVSASGTLGYRPIFGSTSRLTWFDRTGKPLGAFGAQGFYLNLGLSPNDERLAASLGGLGRPEIWILDLARAATPTRLTSPSAGDFDPVWSPSGAQVVFTSNRTGTFDIYQRAADGTGQAELLLKPVNGAEASDWSRDGRFLVYASRGEVEAVPLSDRDSARVKAGKPFALLQTPFDEGDPAVSPDGRWIAYFSDETGQPQIFVRSFPSGGRPFRISEGGGTEPRWRDDGKELFFLAPDGAMMAARIDTAKDFTATVPQMLFRTGLASVQNNHPYVVTRDGQRFIVPVADETAAAQMTVVLNWLSAVRK